MISTRTLWGQALFTFSYIPMQDVVPSAVRMADATEAMICTTHLIVSFLVIRV